MSAKTFGQLFKLPRPSPEKGKVPAKAKKLLKQIIGKPIKKILIKRKRRAGKGVNDSFSKNPDNTLTDGKFGGRMNGKGVSAKNRNNPDNTVTDGRFGQRGGRMDGKGIVKSTDRFFFSPNNRTAN